MPEILVNIIRGGKIESRHRGHVAVVNSAGQVLAYAGNPYFETFFRFAAKSIQAMNTILSGAAEKYHLNARELSILCASHYGEDFHRRVMEQFLKKMNLSVDKLLCGSPISIQLDYALKLSREGHKFDQANSDCSGKHCGFLATCLTKRLPD